MRRLPSAAIAREEGTVEVVYPRCCGLDIHQKTVTACLLTVGPRGERQKELRTFETMTDDLLALADWLVTAGCTHVAMESTECTGSPCIT